MSVSAKEQDECHQAFNYNCRTSKDKLTYDELLLALQCVGVLLPLEEKKKKEEEYASKTAASSDKGYYTYDDFFALYYQKTHETNTEADIAAAFKVFDGDGSGSISKEEMKHIFTTLGERMTDEEVEEMIKMADKNGDGDIDFGEFTKMLMN